MFILLNFNGSLGNSLTQVGSLIKIYDHLLKMSNFIRLDLKHQFYWISLDLILLDLIFFLLFYSVVQLIPLIYEKREKCIFRIFSSGTDSLCFALFLSFG